MNPDTSTTSAALAAPGAPAGTAAGHGGGQDLHWFNAEQATLWVTGLQMTFGPAWSDADTWALAYGLPLQFE